MSLEYTPVMQSILCLIFFVCVPDLFNVCKNHACADVVLLHGCPQSCMPNPVEGLPEVYEDMVEVLLVLERFLT